MTEVRTNISSFEHAYSPLDRRVEYASSVAGRWQPHAMGKGETAN